MNILKKFLTLDPGRRLAQQQAWLLKFQELQNDNRLDREIKAKKWSEDLLAACKRALK